MSIGSSVYAPLRVGARVRVRLALASLVLAAAILPPARSQASGPLRVVTSIAPLAMIAAQLGGDRVAPHAILPPAADPHTFEPRPSQARDLLEADVVVLLGSPLDDWLIADLPVSKTAAIVKLHPVTGADHGDHGHERHEHGGDREHDPHVWLDPAWVREKVVPVLHRAFATADPEGAAIYGASARRMSEDLSNLEDDLREVLSKAKVRTFFAWHPAWAWFAHRFDLRGLSMVGEGEGREPSLRAMVDAVSAARAAGVRAVLVEPQVDPRLPRVLADELGVPLVRVDAIGDAWSHDRATYMELMRFNARAFAEALGADEDEDDEEGAPPAAPARGAVH